MRDQQTFTLQEAARQLAGTAAGIHEMEVRLAHAIEHGELHATVKRWATEQWQGQQLPGNLDCLETRITVLDLDRWRATYGTHNTTA